MAKIDSFVKVDSVTKDGDFLAKGTKVSLDNKVDEKLFTLGNVEEYNAEIHDAEADPMLKLQKDNQDLRDKDSVTTKELAAEKTKASKLEKENEELVVKVSELEKENEALVLKTSELEKQIAELSKPKGK